MFKLRRRTERGASLVEYGLLLTVFGAAVLASIDTLTSAVEDETVVTAEAIGGNPGTIATVTTTTVASSSTTTRPPNDPPVVYAGPDATIRPVWPPATAGQPPAAAAGRPPDRSAPCRRSARNARTISIGIWIIDRQWWVSVESNDPFS